MTNDLTTILIPVDRNRASDEQLRLAGDLARQLGARIVGVIACEHSPALYYETGVLAYDPIAEDRERLSALMAAEEERFRAVLGPGHASIEWRSAVGWPTDFALCEARSADLIVSFVGPGTADDVDLGALVLKAGRPVLLLHDKALPLAGRVLVAWKDAREARRAVRDALPFLSRASAVRLIEIVEGEGSQTAARERVNDVATWLRTHGIEASTSTARSQGSVPDDLDAAAREFDADLIVAGAYGHSRLGEWIFGGVTRHLTTCAGRAVLLSH